MSDNQHIPGNDDEALERAQLAQLLKERSEGAFISGDEMDLRLMAMMDRKKRDFSLRQK